MTANLLNARTLVVLVDLLDSLATGVVTTLSEAVCVILSLIYDVLFVIASLFTVFCFGDSLDVAPADD
ncbi:hypothetical protein [Staphylococcus pasteuri]|uniref:hypothetical protein n=1 Tax=Staphylococcus pasteuri TaxID=45972 RepID=UPI002159FF06|nr:hypothetical protein [Staphylococcus pasteuri]